MQISRHGGPEELVLGEHPDPVPGPGEVLDGKWAAPMAEHSYDLVVVGAGSGTTNPAGTAVSSA